MPMRDHFRPPLDNVASWEEFHGQWPATIVQQLRKKLPPGYVAGPRVHAGSQVEIDVAAYEKGNTISGSETADGESGVGTAVWAPAAPSITVETDLPDYDEYEVRIYDARRKRRLVAAIEIVGPGNKDRPESRNSFLAKCAALLQKGVAISIVDLVTIRQCNLYADLMAFIGHNDPTMGPLPPPLYAASCRWVRKEQRAILESWSHELAISRPLPTLPLWLSEVRAVPLDLEESYEQACDDLSIA
ncbi:MAG: DUF4058 family protein [Planctomycetes bacterium]|nr:DUF4058 family protein [Planctomycetota bacterium]